MAYIHSVVEQIHLSHQTIPAMQESDVHSSTYSLLFIVLFHQPKLVRLLASSFYIIEAVKHIFSITLPLPYFHLLLILPVMYFSCLELMATPALA